MADILHMLPVGASTDDVYRAITTVDGVNGWWTDDASLTPREGSEAEFRFEGGQVAFKMKVGRLEDGRRVEWSVQKPAPPEWSGTRVTWDLQPTDQGTNLLFGHRGWKSTEGSFPAINYNWAYYLTSLKDYVERGEGFPFRNKTG